LDCRNAVHLNPDLACESILKGSYCKPHGERPLICHGVGRDSFGEPCSVGGGDCSDMDPYTCDEAILRSTDRIRTPL
jgi:hypothetical protein